MCIFVKCEYTKIMTYSVLGWGIVANVNTGEALHCHSTAQIQASRHCSLGKSHQGPRRVRGMVAGEDPPRVTIHDIEKLVEEIDGALGQA